MSFKTLCDSLKRLSRLRGIVVGLKWRVIELNFEVVLGRIWEWENRRILIDVFVANKHCWIVGLVYNPGLYSFETSTDSVETKLNYLSCWRSIDSSSSSLSLRTASDSTRFQDADTIWIQLMQLLSRLEWFFELLNWSWKRVGVFKFNVCFNYASK
jgi:hypothetical protein